MSARTAQAVYIPFHLISTILFALVAKFQNVFEISLQPTHNGPIQRPLATILSLVSPEQSESLLCKNIGLYRVPICQLYDLRRTVFKIKPQLAPLAVVVHQIFVDSSGDRLTCFLALRLPQRDRV